MTTDPPWWAEASSRHTAVAPKFKERRRDRKRAYLVAAYVLLMLNLLDLFSTWLALNGGAQELNVLADFLIQTKIPLGFYDLSLIVPSKVVLCGMVIAGAHLLPRRRYVDIVLVTGAWWICGVYSFVVVSNFFVYFGVI